MKTKKANNQIAGSDVVPKLIGKVRQFSILALGRAGIRVSNIAGEVPRILDPIDATTPRNKKIPGSLSGLEAHYAKLTLEFVEYWELAWREGRYHHAVNLAYQAGLFNGHVDGKVSDNARYVEGALKGAAKKRANNAEGFDKLVRQEWTALPASQRKIDTLQTVMLEKHGIKKDRKTIIASLKRTGGIRLGS